MNTFSTVFSFRGIIEVAGQTGTSILQITSPHQDELGCFCWVRVEPLLRGWRKIYGVDAGQAQCLSAQFILAIIHDGILCDDNGHAATDAFNNLQKLPITSLAMSRISLFLRRYKVPMAGKQLFMS